MEAASSSDDYYAVLNVPKDASAEDIKNAYRRICLLYHPDKHHNEEAQRLAKELFPRIQTAYGVLSDPQKRAIYDIYGAAGVNAGYDLAPYYGTTAELKAEFEMRQRREEEERRLSMANANVRMECTVDASQVFAPSLHGDEPRRGFLALLEDVEVSSMSIHQAIDTQLSEDNTVRLEGALLSRNGRGAGNLSLTLHRQHQSDWFSELALGAGMGRSLTLKTQKSFGSDMQGALEVSLHEVKLSANAIGILPSFSALLFRTLSPHLLCSVKLHQSLTESHLTTSFVHHAGLSNASCSVQMGSNKSALMLGLKRPLTATTRLRLACKLGLDSVGLSYGLERSLGDRDRLAIALSIDTADGVTLKLKYTRMRQTYTLPVFLAEDFLPEAVVYGTAIPAVVYAALHFFLFKPLAARQAEQRKLEARRRNRALIAERRREAHAAVQLMQETVARRVQEEEVRGGLVIDEALYGELVTSADRPVDEAAVINVTVPLQCLVKDSQLITSAYSKAGLVGFYDPIPEEPKQLRVRYRFRGLLHQVTIDDDAELRIPRKSDLLPGQQ